MIRNAAIVILSLAAFGVLTLMFCNVEHTWYRRNDRGNIVGSLSVGLWGGRAVIVEEHTSDRVNPPPPLKANISYQPLYTRNRFWHSGPFRIHEEADSLFVTAIEHRFSLLVPFVALALYPTIAFIRGPLRRWRRRRRGRCVTCGYDLTGNVSGVCPECGEKA